MASSSARSAVSMKRSTLAISNNFVADNSSTYTYIPKLVVFMLWLYDNHREFLEPILHLKMVELNELDEQKHTAETL